MKKFLIIMILLSLMNMNAEAQRRRLERGKKPGYKNPTTAAMLSILPGGGQFYLGNITSGVLFAGAGLASILCIFSGITYTETYINPNSETIVPDVRERTTTKHLLRGVGIVGLLTVCGGGALHAYTTATAMNKMYGKRGARRYGLEYQFNKDNIMLALSYKF